MIMEIKKEYTYSKNKKETESIEPGSSLSMKNEKEESRMNANCVA